MTERRTHADVLAAERARVRDLMAIAGASSERIAGWIGAGVTVAEAERELATAAARRDCRLEIRVNGERLASWRRVARADGRSLADVISEAMDLYIGRAGPEG